MSSKKPKKNRKKFFSAKLHELQKSLGANLSRELRKSLNKRSLSVRKDDKVKIVRGKKKGKTGKIVKINRKKLQVFVEGVNRKKADGTEIFIPIHPSNLLLVELVTDDKKRRVAKAKTEKTQEKKEEAKKVGVKDRKEVITTKSR